MMDRRYVPEEFGFSTAAYIPPERPRPIWKTLLFCALLSLIPAVGPAISAIYVDRRHAPRSFTFSTALVSALIQLVALIVLAAIVFVVVVMVLGISVSLEPSVQNNWRT
jgi:uncharacterized membrane protein YoaK (UPF0700 family)